MAWYPHAERVPLPENSTAPPLKPSQIIVHSVVGASSPRGHFNSPGVVVESHLWVSLNGDVEQYVDTARQADANYRANPRAVSVETADNGDPDAFPWTARQLDRLADIIVWAHRVHGIPLARPEDWATPGVGYHTLFSEWHPKAKTCPGLVRITQFPGLLKEAQQLDRRLPDGGPPLPRKVTLSRYLSLGDRGDDVRLVQRRVGVKPDGVFGPQTAAAVRSFQHQHHVRADGVVGPVTVRAMGWRWAG